MPLMCVYDLYSVSHSSVCVHCLILFLFFCSAVSFSDLSNCYSFTVHLFNSGMSVSDLIKTIVLSIIQ